MNMQKKIVISLYFALLLLTIIVGIIHFFIKPLEPVSMMILAVINIGFTTQIMFMYMRKGKEDKN